MVGIRPLRIVILIFFSAILGLLNLLEAVKKGQISITTAPPHPWKIDEWSEWLKSGSSICMPENLITEPGETEDAILDAAEKILHDTIGRKTTGQERIIDEAIFADLRQMMFIPVLHTEYRRFIVLRASYDREVPHIKDSVRSIILGKIKVCLQGRRVLRSNIQPSRVSSNLTKLHLHGPGPVQVPFRNPLHPVPLQCMVTLCHRLQVEP